MVVAIEVCVDSLESGIMAERGGADRIELCSSLAEGGVTPSHGVLQATCRALQKCKVHVLIRPRPGDFLYTGSELDVMRGDILHTVDSGAHGIVFGALTSTGDVDQDRTRHFADMCSALGVDFTFHRAFDVVRNQSQALEALIACRVPRVLTSGGAPSALEGLDQIASLVEQASGRISVMPGGGLTEGNAATVVRCSGAKEIHGTFRLRIPSGMQYLHPTVSFNASSSDGGNGGAGDVWGRFRADGDAVGRIKQQLARGSQGDMGS